jgi:hypothetical protein
VPPRGRGPPIEGYRSPYDKSTEKASAGYYSVFLTKYQVKAECTAAPHSGMLRFTYDKGGPARIQIDLARRVGGTSTLQEVHVVDDHSIEGWMQCTPEGGGWGDGDGHVSYTVYFHAEFSKPLKDYGVWSAAIPDNWTRKREDVESVRYQQCIAAATVTRGARTQQGKHLGFFTGVRYPAGRTGDHESRHLVRGHRGRPQQPSQRDPRLGFRRHPPASCRQLVPRPGQDQDHRRHGRRKEQCSIRRSIIR